MKIVIASRNVGKVRQYQRLLQPLGFDAIPMDNLPEIGEMPEESETMVENAIRKACEVAGRSKLPAIGDDTCLEVDVLGGLPATRTARFAGNLATAAENRKLLLKLLRGTSLADRRACFQIALAIATPSELIGVWTALCAGSIALNERGAGGFGYDSLFIPTGQMQTFAEMSDEAALQISHRASAFAAALSALRRLAAEQGS